MYSYGETNTYMKYGLLSLKDNRYFSLKSSYDTNLFKQAEEKDLTNDTITNFEKTLFKTKWDILENDLKYKSNIKKFIELLKAFKFCSQTIKEMVLNYKEYDNHLFKFINDNLNFINSVKYDEDIQNIENNFRKMLDYSTQSQFEDMKYIRDLIHDYNNFKKNTTMIVDEVNDIINKEDYITNQTILDNNENIPLFYDTIKWKIYFTENKIMFKDVVYQKNIEYAINHIKESDFLEYQKEKIIDLVIRVFRYNKAVSLLKKGYNSNNETVILKTIQNLPQDISSKYPELKLFDTYTTSISVLSILEEFKNDLEKLKNIKYTGIYPITINKNLIKFFNIYCNLVRSNLKYDSDSIDVYNDFKFIINRYKKISMILYNYFYSLDKDDEGISQETYIINDLYKIFDDKEIDQSDKNNLYFNFMEKTLNYYDRQLIYNIEEVAIRDKNITFNPVEVFINNHYVYFNSIYLYSSLKMFLFKMIKRKSLSYKNDLIVSIYNIFSETYYKDPLFKIYYTTLKIIKYNENIYSENSNDNQFNKINTCFKLDCYEKIGYKNFYITVNNTKYNVITTEMFIYLYKIILAYNLKHKFLPVDWDDGVLNFLIKQTRKNYKYDKLIKLYNINVENFFINDMVIFYNSLKTSFDNNIISDNLKNFICLVGCYNDKLTIIQLFTLLIDYYNYKYED